MNLAIKRKIELSEPVQWAIDFLENMIAFYIEEDLEASYWTRMLQEKKRELLEDFYALTPSIASFSQGLGYCEGLNGGRMLVMRILMDVLPPCQYRNCYHNKHPAGAADQINIFEEVITYLKSLHLSPEGDSNLWSDSFFTAVKILQRRNYPPDLFRRGSWPAFIVAPPYREKTAACYLLHPHVIVLYSLPDKKLSKRVFLLLHEIGHLIFGRFLHAGPFLKKFIGILNNLKQEDYPGLFCPSSQGHKEIFANLFAMVVMHDTEEGDELFHHYYHKLGETIFLLQEFFIPGSIFQTRAPAVTPSYF